MKTTTQTFRECTGCGHIIRETKGGTLMAHTTHGQAVTKRSTSEKCSGSGR